MRSAETDDQADSCPTQAITGNKLRDFLDFALVFLCSVRFGCYPIEPETDQFEPDFSNETSALDAELAYEGQFESWRRILGK